VLDEGASMGMKMHKYKKARANRLKGHMLSFKHNDDEKLSTDE
jgi:hypothetical protein